MTNRPRFTSALQTKSPAAQSSTVPVHVHTQFEIVGRKTEHVISEFMLTQITFVKVLIITQIFIKVKEKLEVSEAYITLAPSHVPPGQRGKDEGGKRASQSGGRKEGA